MALDELATTSEATGPVVTEGGQDANLEQQAKAATKTAINVASSSAVNANQSAEMSVSIQRQDAETEAHDALRKAVQSIKALRSLATINLSDEFSQLSAIMSELSVLPEVSKNTPQEDGTPADPPGEHVTAAKQAPSEPSDPKSRQIATERARPCIVERLTMDDWRMHLLDTLGQRNGSKTGRVLPSPSNKNEKHDTAPLIQAFYRTVPSISAGMNKKYTEEDFENAYATAQKVEKPQRILINSPLLLLDLEKICGLALPNTAFEMIPPFKLLIHNWDGIQSTLERLTVEYEELYSRSKTSMSSTEVQSMASAGTIGTPNMSLGSSVDHADSASAQNNPGFIAQQHVVANIEENDISSSNNERPTTPKLVEPNVDSEQTIEKDTLEIRISNLHCLRDFVQSELSNIIGLKMKIKQSSLDTITFEEVYHLYNPGDLIVGQEDEVDLLFQVYAVTGGRRRLYRAANATPYRRRNEELEADDSPRAGIGTFTDVVIDCIQLHWDGDTLGPHRSTHRILHFTGEKRIVDFEYYPIQFRKNQQELRQQLSIRGRRVIDCYGHKKFDGQTAMAGLQYGILRNYANMHDISWTYLRHEMPQFFAETASRGRDLDSDVYVDMKNFCQMVPALKNEPYRLGRTRPSFREVTEGFEFEGDAHLIVVADHDLDVARSENFLSHNTHLSHPQRPEDVEGTEECLMLLGQCVPAFDFRSRKWDWLDVDKLEEIDKTHEARRRAWRDLVIEESYSQLLLSLVDNHTSAYDHKKKRNALGHGVPTTQVDLIQGKGRGLILLLHGPPGTGKTSTAEAIAAYTGKPLYAITCGDIGVTARDVENSLRRHTERAEKWGCVLLLDEADVFLARRTWTDMNRNAVVSVFLRHLEYYSGILFLTTNIVGIIDEAFKSRIHVALRYDAIDLESTRRIWSNLLDRITKDNDTSDVRIKFDKDILLKFATTHFKKYIDDGTAWNARQIRNAFSTAIAMGQYDRMERIRKEGLTPESVAASGNPGLMTIKLEKRNFAKVARTATEFEDYINAVRGDDARNALDSKQRDDYFAQQLAPQPRKNRGGTVYYGSGSKSAKGKKARTRPVDSEVEHDEEDEKPAVQKGKSKQRKDRFTDSEEGDSDESDGLSD